MLATIPQKHSAKMGTSTKPIMGMIAPGCSPPAPPFEAGVGLVVLGPGLEHTYVVVDPEVVSDLPQVIVSVPLSKVAVTPVQFLHKDGTAAAWPATNLTATHLDGVIRCQRTSSSLGPLLFERNGLYRPGKVVRQSPPVSPGQRRPCPATPRCRAPLGDTTLPVRSV